MGTITKNKISTLIKFSCEKMNYPYYIEKEKAKVIQKLKISFVKCRRNGWKTTDDELMSISGRQQA